MIGDEGSWLLLKSICLSTRDGSVKFVRGRKRSNRWKYSPIFTRRNSWHRKSLSWMSSSKSSMMTMMIDLDKSFFLTHILQRSQHNWWVWDIQVIIVKWCTFPAILFWKRREDDDRWSQERERARDKSSWSNSSSSKKEATAAATEATQLTPPLIPLIGGEKKKQGKEEKSSWQVYDRKPLLFFLSLFCQDLRCHATNSSFSCNRRMHFKC